MLKRKVNRMNKTDHKPIIVGLHAHELTIDMETVTLKNIDIYKEDKDVKEEEKGVLIMMNLYKYLS